MAILDCNLLLLEPTVDFHLASTQSSPCATGGTECLADLSRPSIIRSASGSESADTVHHCVPFSAGLCSPAAVAVQHIMSGDLRPCSKRGRVAPKGLLRDVTWRRVCPEKENTRHEVMFDLFRFTRPVGVDKMSHAHSGRAFWIRHGAHSLWSANGFRSRPFVVCSAGCLAWTQPEES